jgi:Protein of unknown function (DUF3575)
MKTYNLRRVGIMHLFMGAFSFFSTDAAFCQSGSDSIQRKNIIKYDISGNILYNNTYNFSFERVIKKNQTMSLTVGNEQLPTLLSLFEDDESESTTTRKTASGFKLGLDYRFYLGKENKYNSPHGVYIGPYLAYHDFKNSWNLTIEDGTGTQTGVVNGKFQVLNVGFQAGYQFLINNRWSIDMSFLGASLSNYRARMDVDGNFNMDDSEISQAFLDRLTEKFPLLGDLIEDGTVDESGKVESWAMGIRYLVHVGYAFGGGKKKKK